MADARDLLTIEEGKRAVRINEVDSSDNDLLPSYITAASRLLDRWAGHTVAMTVTAELHDGTNRSGRGYRSMIILRRRPVIAVTTVIEHRGGSPITLTAETTTQQPSDAYLLDSYDPEPTLFRGTVRRRASGEDAWFEHGRRNIAVTYTAGRVQSTTMVDARFKRAAALTLENMWRDREPGLEPQGEFDVPRQSFPTFSVPRAVRELLTEEIGQHRPWGIA